MRITQRQPICITRLKKKPSSHNIPSLTDITTCKESRLQLHEILPNLIHDSSQTKQTFCGQISRQSFVNRENIGYSQKQNILAIENCPSISRDEQLLKRVKELEQNNQYLAKRNQDLATLLLQQQSQKRKLNARIERLEKELRKIESQFQQQYQSQLSKNQPIKPAVLDLRLSTPKQKQYSTAQRKQGFGYRRLSFHQNTQYKSEDLSTKVKQYRNQLQIQKIRRINLERELQACKQNTKLQLKNELQALQHKIENMKQVIHRKDKQICEKQDLIQRYIVKK